MEADYKPDRWIIGIGAKATALEIATAQDMGRYLAAVTKRAGVVQIEPRQAHFTLGTPASHSDIRIDDAPGQPDAGRVLSRDGDAEVCLAGSTPQGAARAAYAFLEEVAGVGFFADEDRIPYRESLPLDGHDFVRVPRFELRAFLMHPFWASQWKNCCRVWGFDEWKRTIDWMRRRGLNVLPLYHDEGTHLWGEAFFRAFPEIPKNDETLRNYVLEPKSREDLTKRIVAYARDNGIAIAYNLFYSQVPDFFRNYYPDLEYHQVNMDSVALCAAQPETREIMRRLYGEIIRTHGTDDQHLYIVCPYQHEKKLCDHFESRVEPTRQVVDLLTEIDPQARVFVETWCWQWGTDPAKEWLEFKSGLPESVGIVDWDSRNATKPELAKAIDWYRPRAAIQLVHDSMEGFSPPAVCGWANPSDVLDLIDGAARNRLHGAAVFSILARSNPLLSDLATSLMWREWDSAEEFFADYVRRRHHISEADTSKLVEAYKLLFEASDYAMLVPPHYFSAETQLLQKLQNGDALDTWLPQRLEEFSKRLEQAEKAKCLAGTLLDSSDRPDRDLLADVKFVCLRWKGIIALYKARQRQDDWEANFDEAVRSIRRAQNLFGDVLNDTDFSLAEIVRRAPDVRFNPLFIEDPLRVSRWWTENGFRKFFHVSPETLPRWEARVLELDPAHRQGAGNHK